MGLKFENYSITEVLEEETSMAEFIMDQDFPEYHFNIFEMVKRAFYEELIDDSDYTNFLIDYQGASDYDLTGKFGIERYQDGTFALMEESSNSEDLLEKINNKYQYFSKENLPKFLKRSNPEVDPLPSHYLPLDNPDRYKGPSHIKMPASFL